MIRNQVFQFRVSDDELGQLKADAEAAGETVSNWIRRCIRVARVDLIQSVAPSRPNGHGGSAGSGIGVSSGVTPVKVTRKGKANGKQKTSRKRH